MEGKVTASSNKKKQRFYQWWNRAFRALGRALHFFWGVAIFGLVLNITASWLVTPLKQLNIQDTILGWMFQHFFIVGPIIMSLLLLTIVTEIINHLTAEQTPLSHSTQGSHEARKHLLMRLDVLYKDLSAQYQQGLTLIPLYLSQKADAVSPPSREMFRSLNLPEHPFPPGTSILQVYDDAGGELFIIGQPGAGKTLLLLGLAQELLKRAQQDEQHPIPLIFPLSSWANKQQSIDNWLVDTMYLSYHVPHHLGQMWVKDNHIHPLFDGLDEVPLISRPSCIEAINIYHQNYISPLVVCSRNDAYFSQETQLTLQRAVVIDPLTKQQVDTYLSSAGNTLRGVRTALRRSTSLQELATTPLLLSTLVLSYQGKSSKDLPQAGEANLQQQIIEHYIARMFEHKGTNLLYGQQQVVNWLSWLAKQMKKHNQTEFYLERLQMDWYRQLRFCRFPFSVLVGIVLGVFIWFGYGLFYGSHLGVISGIVDGLLVGCCVTLLYIFINGFLLDWLEENERTSQMNSSSQFSWKQHLLLRLLTNRFGYGLTFGIIIGPLIGIPLGIASGVTSGISYGLLNVGILTLNAVLYGQLEKEIHPAEVVNWSWQKARRTVVRFAGGGFVLGFALGLFAIPRVGIIGALFLGLFLWMSYEAIILLVGGFSHEVFDTQKRMKPNQGIRRSFRNSIVFGILGFGVGGVVFGSIFTLIFTLTNGPTSGLIAGVISGATAAEIIGLREGGYACLQHTVLRLLLWRGKYAPWDYSRFLDEATECTLLHKVGGGYIFKHAIFQDYFASLHPER